MNYEKKLSEESGSIFNEGIGMILYRWSALQLAVDNEWGGRQSRRKAEQLHSDIFSWFTQSTGPLYIDDLEEILFEGLQSLNTMVDDGSIEEVAEKLMLMHEECLDGNFKSVEVLREASNRRVAVRHVKQVNENDGDDDDDNNDNEGHSPVLGDGSSKIVVGSSKSLENSSSEDMLVDEPTPTPSAEAEGGWVVVGPKRGRGKRN
ncbi:Pre-rRNA-processing protein TSR [Parasponia andersonii]|uniref:Pre-rRNA-processing protein TSR n=1 Tax=Parasponia andersonii TaxID=3476 RepID=A0A2P5A6M5_PARAD|nr:Pre-rRNA-processing protein TSR [Parasponia andersonii]